MGHFSTYFIGASLALLAGNLVLLFIIGRYLRDNQRSKDKERVDRELFAELYADIRERKRIILYLSYTGGVELYLNICPPDKPATDGKIIHGVVDRVFNGDEATRQFSTFRLEGSELDYPIRHISCVSLVPITPKQGYMHLPYDLEDQPEDRSQDLAFGMFFLKGKGVGAQWRFSNFITNMISPLPDNKGD